jgi:hypothetical protein
MRAARQTGLSEIWKAIRQGVDGAAGDQSEERNQYQHADNYTATGHVEH